MSVYRDGSGGAGGAGGAVWRFRKSIKLPDGRRVRLSGTPLVNTRNAAEAAERRAIEEALHPPAVAIAEVRFDTFTLDWLATYPPATNRKSTQLLRDLHIRMHLIPFFQDAPLSSIDSLWLTRLVAHLRTCKRQTGMTGKKARKKPGTDQDKTISLSYVVDILRTLRKVLADAVEWGKLSRLPKFPKVKVPRSRWDWLRPEESSRLLEAAGDPEEYAKILFALRTGARVGEQTAVEWSDIDLVARKVTFSRTIYRGEEGESKTGHSRTVDLSPVLVKALQRIRHLRGSKVFCDGDGRPFTRHHFSHLLNKLLRRAGLRKIRWHDLRHSFASQLVSVNVPLKYVQEAMGHTNINMTMRYAHLAPSNGQEVARLDALVGTG